MFEGSKRERILVGFSLRRGRRGKRVDCDYEEYEKFPSDRGGGFIMM